MKKVGGWFGASKQNNASTVSLTALDEPKALQDAMAAVLHILNDDVETADSELSRGNTPFHKLGKGVTAFLRATLSFEQDDMREAQERLALAESSAAEHQRHAQRGGGHRSKIYPAGSEYALCHAEAQLMSAVVAVLNESLTESIRGFYKLRKAYATLQELSDHEKRFLKANSSISVSSLTGSTSRLSVNSTVAPADKQGVPDDDSDEFEDAPENLTGKRDPSHYQGHLDTAKPSKVQTAPSGNGAPIPRASTDSIQDYAIEKHTTDAVDLFIHAGTNMCFGILQLMLSLIPPAFSRLLSLVGFHGDRDAGISMLWRATRYAQNINGSMAGLVVLGYYNGMVNFCDIVGSDSYPKQRCEALLAEMRKHYPRSRLWLLEEARMLAGEKKLDEAIERTSTDNESPLKQVAALQWFERSLECMYAHRYDDCAASFLQTLERSSWSPGLYLAMAGACHVERYRILKGKDPAAAKKHAEKATDLFRQVPSQAGKKRFMARQLPFDAFVLRKVQKWEDRSKTWKIDFIDAIGVSPVEEFIYFWNGYKKMPLPELEESLRRLAWNEDPAANPTWRQESLDEHAILAFLRSVVMSRMGNTADAKELLRTEILSHEWSEFKGHLRDNWTLPAAHYEMAVNLWMESDQGGKSAKRDLATLKECSVWLEKAAKWETYDLDARIGMKITTARETLRKCGVVPP